MSSFEVIVNWKDIQLLKKNSEFLNLIFLYLYFFYNMVEYLLEYNVLAI